MRKSLRCLLLFTMVMFLCYAGQALASPYPMPRMQGILDNIEAFQGTTTGMSIENPSYFDNMGGTATFTLLEEIAAFKDVNYFGVFDGEKTVEIFSGPQDVGSQTTINLDQLGSRFGFYLDSKDPRGGLFYSDGAMNLDNIDHMVAYRSGDEILLGFEDLFGGGDLDFDDMVVSIKGMFGQSSGPAPVPEPGTILLVGSGLAGLAAMRRRKNC